MGGKEAEAPRDGSHPSSPSALGVRWEGRDDRLPALALLATAGHAACSTALGASEHSTALRKAPSPLSTLRRSPATEDGCSAGAVHQSTPPPASGSHPLLSTPGGNTGALKHISHQTLFIHYGELRRSTAPPHKKSRTHDRSGLIQFRSSVPKPQQKLGSLGSVRGLRGRWRCRFLLLLASGKQHHRRQSHHDRCNECLHNGLTLA